ncbi:MAG: DUF1850 domain-containing protein [Tissierellales bacterium]|nr:DUF1850 domain-containing protein [Tissierellales bacterium]MBN2826405.1 DUF1850 domain-containing protein [Tissierellales bacterium]
MNIRKKVKHANASSFLKKSIFLMMLLIVAFIFFFEVGIVKWLILSHQETGEIYLKTRVETNDTLQYYWIHSFEHIPWTEDFEVLDSNGFKLREIAVAGFGAGIPENKGIVSVEDGMVVMREINEYFEDINWINSHTALKYIGLNHQEIIRGSDLPHHEPLKLMIEERFSIWIRFQ